MLRFQCAVVATIVLCFGAAASADELDDLIDSFVEVSEPDVGFAPTYSGSDFLPYEGSEQLGTFIVGATQRTSSEAMKTLVSRGVEAVPALVRHLGDDRKIKIEELKAGGISWMDFPDEYDFNSRTRDGEPPGVNRGTSLNDDQPDRHAVTVGDLCFVALGQIVNRSFSAVRYQPTAGMIISSPTHSKALRDVVVADWEGLTRERHREQLVDDFRRPDHEGRRIGAYLRLSFYYPETVEELVLEELKKPTGDTSAASTFCHDLLNETADAAERQRRFDEFVAEHGAAGSQIVRDYLFDDLEQLELDEDGGVDPPPDEEQQRPRELLIQLYQLPKDVKSEDRPPREFADDFERARLIKALTHDSSRKIGDVVKAMYEQRHPDDDYFAPACLKCLANRGYGEFLAAQIREIDPKPAKTNSLHYDRIEAIATSRDVLVQAELAKLLQATTDDNYFTAALEGAGQVDEESLFKMATALLAALPDDTRQGRGTLKLVRDRFPDRAKQVFDEFLKSKHPKRIATVCEVLWYGHPLSFEVLAPYLSDQRPLEGFSIPLRVCDRVAQAMSPAGKIRFDSEWPQAKRDKVIEQLKEYSSRPKTETPEKPN